MGSIARKLTRAKLKDARAVEEARRLARRRELAAAPRPVPVTGTASKMAGRAVLATALAMALFGCAKVPGDFCSTAAPIRPTLEAIAAMSDDEVSETLAHNTYGARACGWRP
ncbi:MAG TPA: hypothetical protein VL017_08820 [Devosia sp.]|nr:hypothetical protein [Devosia sp.]